MTNPRKPLSCSICDKPIKPDPITGWSEGNNAEPVNSGRCCGDCNTRFVIPLRIAKILRDDARAERKFLDDKITSIAEKVVTKYELRVRELEAEGMTRSDAQAVVDAEQKESANEK